MYLTIYKQCSLVYCYLTITFNKTFVTSSKGHHSKEGSEGTMSYFDEYFSSSSAHGFHYLTSKRPFSVRLFWLIILTLFFIACFTFIRKDFQESNKHPISTTISTIPLNSLSFPSLTIQSKAKAFDLGTLKERIFNYFHFDCARFASEEDAKLCQVNSKPVVHYFGESYLDIVPYVFDQLRTDLGKQTSSSTLMRMARVFVCMGNSELRSVNYHLAQIVERKIQLENIQRLFAENFLLPKSQAISSIDRYLTGKLNKSIDWNRSDCKARMKNYTQVDLLELVTQSMALETHLQGLGLGTFLKIASKWQSFLFPQAWKELDYKIHKTLNTQTDQSQMNFISCYNWDENCPESFVNGVKNYSNLFNTFTSDMIASLTSGKEEVYHELAILMALELNLPQEVVMPVEMNKRGKNAFVPALWLCQYNGEILPSCFDSLLTFSSTGVGVTIGKGSFKDHFHTVGSDDNEHVVSQQGFTGYKAKDEIAIYLKYSELERYDAKLKFTCNHITCFPRADISAHDDFELNIFDLDSFTLKPGLEYTIELLASKTDADANLHKVDINARNCLMPEEHASSFYKTYSRSNCIMERAYHEAYKKINCTPWYAPYMPTFPANVPTCNEGNEAWFKKALETNIESSVDCLEACKSSTYTLRAKEKPFKKDAVCLNILMAEATSRNPARPNMPNLLYNFLTTLDLSSALAHINNIDDKFAACEMNLAGTSILRFKTKQNRINVIRQHKRVSFNSQLAKIGNNFILHVKVQVCL